MALALRLLLLLLLAVALPARAAQAAPMPARGADWDQDMEYLEALLDDGLKTSAHAGAEPVGEAASQPMSTTEPLGDGEGVSAGRTSPAPLLAPAPKPGSHRRGPPRRRNKPTGVKKSLEKSKHKVQMLHGLERRREMEAEAVLKAAFPGGSSGSLAASAAGREAMPGTVTGDWDQDMEYLEALLDDGLKTSAHAGGPLRGKNQDIEDKKSLEASELLDQMLSDLERRRGMDQMAMEETALPGESRGSLSAPAAGKEELPATGTGPGDVLGKSGTNAQDTSSSPRVFCPQDVRKSCMVGTVVTLITVPLSMVLCYVGFRWWKGKEHRPAPAPASQPGRPGSPSPPGSPKTVHFDSSQTWPRQQPQSPRKAEHQHSLPPPRPPSPAVKRKPPEIPPPPPLPSQPPWSSS